MHTKKRTAPQFLQQGYHPQENHQLYQQPSYQAHKQYRVQKQMRDKLLLIGAIFSVLWFIFVCSSFASLMNSTPSGSEAEQLGYEIGTSIGLMLHIPFLITSFLGTVFNWLAWLMSKRGFAIAAGVLFSVSVFLSIGNGFGYIVSLVLCFIGASRLKKLMY